MPRAIPWPPPVYVRDGKDSIRIYVGPRKYREEILGPTGSEEARRAYTRILLELEASGRRAADTAGASDLTVVELAAAWLEEIHAKRSQGHFARDKHAWTTVVQLYGDTCAAAFSPLNLKACRASWLREGRADCPLLADYHKRLAEGARRKGERPPKILSRRYVNRLARAVQEGFSWGVEEELIPEATAAALDRVRILREGHTEAPDHAPIRPAQVEEVERALPHLPPIVADLVRVQLLTGMRPAEACALRPVDLDRAWKVIDGVTIWLYRLDAHKCDWRGHHRWIPIGPRAQAILKPYLERAADAYCFSPRETAERYAASKGRRYKPGRNRVPGVMYSTDSYDRCVLKACKRAKVKWTPNQLRHTAGTRVETEYGREDARVFLGHQSPSTTSIYAEGVERAALVSAKIG